MWTPQLTHPWSSHIFANSSPLPPLRPRHAHADGAACLRGLDLGSSCTKGPECRLRALWAENFRDSGTRSFIYKGVEVQYRLYLGKSPWPQGGVGKGRVCKGRPSLK